MKLFYLLYSFIMCLSLCAQNKPQKQFTTKNGLLSNDVSVLHIDSKGRLWIGSRAGLAVQNHNNFKQDSISIRFKYNNITAIEEDESGSLWVGSYGQGVLYNNSRDPKLITEQDGLVSNTVRAIKIFNNAVYVATSHGLSIISLSDFSIRNPDYKFDPEIDFQVTALYSHSNKMYCTTNNHGIYEITSEKLIPVSNTKKIFSAFNYQDTIYFGTQSNLIRFNPDEAVSSVIYPLPYVWDGEKVDGTILWATSGIFSSEGGLYTLNPQTNAIDKIKEISFKDLTSVVYDSNKHFLYLGTKENGLIQIQWHSAIQSFSDYGKVYNVLKADNQTILVTEKGIFFNVNDQKSKIITLADLKKIQSAQKNKFSNIITHQNHFFEIDADTPASEITFYNSVIEENKLWITTNVGIFKMSCEGKIEAFYPIHTYEFTFFNKKLFETNPYGGVRIYNNIDKMDYRYFREQNNPKIPRNIVSIAKDSSTIYFASATDGFYTYSKGTFTSFLHNTTFTEAKLRQVTTIDENKVLTATDFNDIYLFDFSNNKPKINLLISNDKIIGNYIYFLEQHNGKIYAATNKGLNIFDGKKHYFIDEEQGLRYSVVYNGHFYDDVLYLATPEGYFTLDIHSYFEHTNEMSPIITKFKVNKTFWSSSQIKTKLANPNIPVELKYNENSLRLFFELKQVKYPEKLEFSYRLKKGEAWSPLADPDKIDLHYLTPGTYKVELKIRDLDSAQEKTFLLITLHVQKPFYASWYFITLLALIILAITLFIFRLRLQKLKQKQKNKDRAKQLAVEQERNQLVFEKRFAEVRLQALQSQMNSHFIFNVLSNLQYYILDKDMDNALYYLDRFARLIRMTLEYAGKQVISLQDEIDYLTRYIEIENLRLNPEIVFSVKTDSKVDLSSVKIMPLLLQPFIENCVIHAFPKEILNPKITVYIKNQYDSIKLTIEDNGVGFQSEKKSNHQSIGMRIVKERIHLIQRHFNKEIEIESSPEGTKIHIYLEKQLLQ